MTSSDPKGGRAPGPRSGWLPPTLAPNPSAGAAAKAAEAPVETLAAVRKRAYNEGFAEGLAAGRAQAEAMAAEIGTLLQAMASPFGDADAVLIRELTALVERVSEAVLDRELATGAYDIETLLEQALKVMGRVDLPVQLTVNPADAALCRDLQMPEGQTLELVEDASLQRGGLRLKAGSRIVDASVEARLQEVFASLRDGAGLPDPETEAATPLGAKAGDEVAVRDGAGHES
ncbi:MAG: FliH/SctL family protein [Pseudomonadota bacterium]